MISRLTKGLLMLTTIWRGDPVHFEYTVCLRARPTVWAYLRKVGDLRSYIH